MRTKFIVTSLVITMLTVVSSSTHWIMTYFGISGGAPIGAYSIDGEYKGDKVFGLCTKDYDFGIVVNVPHALIMLALVLLFALYVLIMWYNTPTVATAQTVPVTPCKQHTCRVCGIEYKCDDTITQCPGCHSKLDTCSMCGMPFEDVDGLENCPWCQRQL